MDTSLVINSTDPTGKKLQKAVSNINPAKSNALLKTFAQKVNSLTENVYTDATRINKQSVEEEDSGSGGSGGSGKLEPVLTFGEADTTSSAPVEIPFEYNGDGMIFACSDDTQHHRATSVESERSVIYVEQPCNVTLYAAEGEHYAAKFATYTLY